MSVIHDHPIVLGIPSRRRDRWALLIVSFGWALLSALTFAGIAGRSGEGWALIAAMISLITLLFWCSGLAVFRKLAAAGTVAFGIVRSADYLLDGVGGPVAVWVIVCGLALAAYRSSVRQDRAP